MSMVPGPIGGPTRSTAAPCLGVCKIRTTASLVFLSAGLLVGPLVGAITFTGLQDTIARSTDYWRAVLGGTILLLVMVFPQGLAGFVSSQLQTRTRRESNTK